MRQSYTSHKFIIWYINLIIKKMRIILNQNYMLFDKGLLVFSEMKYSHMLFVIFCVTEYKKAFL